MNRKFLFLRADLSLSTTISNQRDASICDDFSARLKNRIQEKDEVTRQLESKNASLDRKCERLRDYIRKLTNKCEEWANYADSQNQVLQKIKKNGQRHANVEQSQPVHLANDTPCASQQNQVERSQWSVERKMIDRVINLVGEDDLDELASELRNFGLK